MTMDRCPMTTEQVIAAALAEDVGAGDVTTQFFVPEGEHARGRIFTKEPGVAAGTSVASDVFRAVDPSIEIKVLKPDGAMLVKGDTLLEIAGPTRSLLTAERTALNFMQRLSGVATLTRRYVEAVAGTRAAILDTRKTTPLLRELEKQAVAAGGGMNHRRGLYDAVMVKDNHLLAESRPEALQQGINAARAAHPGIRIELEADTLDQFREFLKLTGVDWILLDNMPRAHLREAVALVRTLPPERRVKLEASGGVTIETVRPIAETGVDYVSIGALTHSARALDLSLELTRAPGAD